MSWGQVIATSFIVIVFACMSCRTLHPEPCKEFDINNMPSYRAVISFGYQINITRVEDLFQCRLWMHYWQITWSGYYPDAVMLDKKFEPDIFNTYQVLGAFAATLWSMIETSFYVLVVIPIHGLIMFLEHAGHAICWFVVIFTS